MALEILIWLFSITRNLFSFRRRGTCEPTMSLMNWMWCDGSHFPSIIFYSFYLSRVPFHHQHCCSIPRGEVKSIKVIGERALRRGCLLALTIDRRPRRAALDSTLSIRRHQRWQWLKDLKRWPMIKREWIIMSFINDSAGCWLNGKLSFD